MSSHTAITWADATWNPVTGCSRVSEACQACYAETWSHRYGWTHHPWTAIHASENVQLHPERLEAPLRWTKSRRIFVNSMSDLFHEEIPEPFLDETFAIMALASHHIFQILTKRPERMHTYLTNPTTPDRIANAVVQRALAKIDPQAIAKTLRDGTAWPLPHVWLGVSVENQHWADIRIPWLLQTPATIRFISAEPLLGPVDLEHIPLPVPGHDSVFVNALHRASAFAPRLHWIIVGAESGPKPRPMDDDWVRTLRDQCQATNTAFFFKQRVDASGHKTIHPVLDGQIWEDWPRIPSNSLS